MKTQIMKLECYIETTSENALKDLEHHIEYLLDLDSYPEVKVLVV